MNRARSVARSLAPAAAILVIGRIGWPVSVGTFVSGIVLGITGCLLALGMALIFRASRVVSFAQANLGLLPATVAVVLADVWSLPWLVAVAVGIAGAALVGLGTETLLMRRFRHAAPTVGTVATIGVAQLMGFGALFFPGLWGLVPAIRTFDPPFAFRATVGQVVFDANDLIATVVSVVAIVALGWFLHSTATGLAVRAVAESPDRAAMLGIPVGRIGSLVWIIATVLAFISVYFTAGITGLPPGTAFSFGLLLRSLAALVVGRMSNLTTIASTSVALGVLETAMSRSTTGAAWVGPLLLGIIAVTLLAQSRRSRSRRESRGAWNTATEFRDLPASVAGLASVRAARAAVAAVVVSVVVFAPAAWGTAGTLTVATMCAYAVVGLSMVVLSGWAGQVSLGQMAFVGTGAAITAKASVVWGLDPLVSMVLSGLVGAAVALVVGLPALRLRGLHLAVVTLALSVAASTAVFSNDVVDWIPVGSFDRPALLSRVALDSPRRQFHLALGVLAVAVIGVRGLRRSRWGRALVAQRDNDAAAASFGVSVTHARLSAFAVSGFIAGVGGSLLALQAAAFRPESYGVGESVTVFVAAVTGGLGTPLGAVIGALYLRGSQWLLPDRWQLLASAVGVLGVLLVIPEGLSALWFRGRDRVARLLAAREGIEEHRVGRRAEAPT